jgi:hypothetical protein
MSAPKACTCRACEALSAAIDRHTFALAHVIATRDAAERAGRAVDAVHKLPSGDASAHPGDRRKL